MKPSQRLLSFLAAGVAVALLVVGFGADAAVFLFFASGMVLAVLFGEAGAGPAPEGELANGAEEKMEFAGDARP